MVTGFILQYWKKRGTSINLMKPYLKQQSSQFCDQASHLSSSSGKTCHPKENFDYLPSSLSFLSVFMRFIFFFILFAICQSASFACSTISLVSSNSHFGIVHRIEANLYAQPSLQPKLTHLMAEAVKDNTFSTTETCLIVAIGAQALSAVLKTKTKVPILSVLIRKSSFFTLLKTYNRKLNDPAYPVTAIYLDQPLQRQLNLLQCILPATDPKSAKSISVLLGPQSITEQEYLQKLARESNLKLSFAYVNKFENPVAVLDGAIDEAKAVLAIPDSRIYNPKTARGILLTAFHKRVPLLGYSRTYVNNGALAAVYSTTKQLAQQTANQILSVITHPGKLPEPQYPQEFTVAVNYQVARSLEINIESEAKLKEAMDKMENLHSHPKVGLARG